MKHDYRHRKTAAATILFVAATLLIAGCANKPPETRQPTASDQLTKLIAVIDLVEESRPEAANKSSVKMKKLLAELDGEIDNIDDPATQKIAIEKFLAFIDGQSESKNNLLSEIFGILTAEH